MRPIFIGHVIANVEYCWVCHKHQYLMKIW